MTQSEQIIECEKRLLEALKKGDTKVLDELLHDNLIFNIPTGQTITKAMDIENYQSGILTVTEISATEQIVKSVDDICTVAVTLHLEGKYRDQPIGGTYRYLRVWKSFNNSWKVIAGSGFQI
jgi:hypothetical protein